MMEILQRRRSIRKYKKKKVEEDKIKKLIQAALLSPSSRSLCPWEFLIVEDEKTIKDLASAKDMGSSFLEQAPLAIVILANEEVSDVWVEDSSIASIIIQLMAESLGLGSCWIQIRKRQHKLNVTAGDYIRGLLGLPASTKVESIIAIGYPDEEKPAHDLTELKYEKIHRNVYGGRK